MTIFVARVLFSVCSSSTKTLLSHLITYLADVIENAAENFTQEQKQPPDQTLSSISNQTPLFEISYEESFYDNYNVSKVKPKPFSMLYSDIMLQNYIL